MKDPIILAIVRVTLVGDDLTINAAVARVATDDLARAASAARQAADNIERIILKRVRAAIKARQGEALSEPKTK